MSPNERIARPIEFATTGFCPALEGASVASASEALGFDVQMFGENHTKAADVFGEMRDAAQATTRIRLLCGPVNFVTRDPGVVASSIVPVQILSHGRAICGIARGDSAVAVAGKRPSHSDALARDLQMLRTYLQPEAVDFPTYQSSLEWIGALPYAPVPIEMVCSGPRSMGLAAQWAERIGLSVGFNATRVRWALHIIDEALERCGRSRDSVRIGLFGPLAVGCSRADAPAVLRQRVAPWAHMSSSADPSQQPDEMRRITAALRDAYDYRHHRHGATIDNSNAAIIDETFADWFGVGGPPSYVIDRLAELAELGVDYFSVALESAELEMFAAKVMPILRSVRH